MRCALVFLAAALTLSVPGHALGQKEPKRVDCHKDLKKAVELIDQRWSFRLFKPGAVNFVQAYDELAPQARQAKEPEACAEVIARFMAKLGDGHSRLQYYPGVERSRPKIEVRSRRERLSRIPGQKPPLHAYVFSRDTTDETLRAILPGSEILAVDGVSADSLYRLMERRAAGSTDQWIDYLCDRELLLGPPDSEIELTLREPGGATKTVNVRRPPYPSEEEQKREAELYRDTVRIATWKRLDGGWGYIKYTTFSHGSIKETLDPFDAAVDSLLDTPGLIIDLRGNGGGYVDAMAQAAGRFVQEKFVLSYFQVRQPGQQYVAEVLDWSTGSYTVKPPVASEPRGKIYAGPLVILIDRRCFSACEGFTAGLQSIERALVVGSSASGGGSGWVSGLRLPSGAVISFSWTVAWRPDGQQIEGNGVVPDLRVSDQPTDWAVGRDRVLERAIKALQQGEAKPLAVAGGG